MSTLVAAVEGGGSKFRCAVGEDHQSILAEQAFVTRDPEATLADVARFFAPYRSRISSCGVACFGPLELSTEAGDAYGSLLRTPKPGWSGFPLRARLQAAVGASVAIDTDVNAAALAEWRFGALHGADAAVYVTVGTGVGVGVLLHGRPLHGLLHPELGHLRIHSEAPGFCPFHGACVEGLVSAPALRARTGKPPEALADSDPVWPWVADTLGALLHAIVLAYAPGRIVLGGGVLQRSDLLYRVRQALVRSLGDYIPRDELSARGIQSYVVAPAFGQRSGLVGAFALAAAMER